MMHLTEDILIQYQFDLLNETGRHDAAEHLTCCNECRQTLASLKRKFSALDVLDVEEEMPQSLIEKTLRHCSGPRKTLGPLVWWRWGGMLSAAAALVIVGFVWLHRPTQPIKDDLAGGDSLYSRSDAPATEKRGWSESTPSLVRVVGPDSILDKPPFAPASAIELVVLPNPDTMQVTIYNSADLTLVRDTRKLVLKPGWNWLQFMWAGTKIDPTSLSLRPLEYADNVRIEQLVFPARLRELGRWLVRSEVEGAVPFEITYFTSGLVWRAVYEGTLSTNENTMNLKGYVRVENNSGQDYVNTQTRLLLGQVRLLDEIAVLAGRKYPYGPDVTNDKWGMLLRDEGSKLEVTKGLSYAYDDDFYERFAGDVEHGIKKIEKEGLSEYFLYTIEGTEDLQDTWGKRLESMDVSGIPVTSMYKYDEQRYGTETVRFVSFKNDDEHELGENPLPEGSIRIFRNVNDKQNLSYVGQSAFKYIPVNEDVELNLGASPLVKIEPKLMDVKTANHTFDKDNNVSGWDEVETWQIKMTNTRDIPADIEITRDFGIDYWELKMQEPAAGIQYTKHDKRRARFTAMLEPRSEKEFSYVVTKYQGQRSEQYVRMQKEQER